MDEFCQICGCQRKFTIRKLNQTLKRQAKKKPGRISIYFQPGFMETDTVARGGNSLAVDFVLSLTITDILTGWTECRATWNKGSLGIIKQTKAIEEALPFDLLGFDCDNGSEFLSYHLLRYFTEHPNKPQFTRSRPY